ncbi:hypothetical protein MHBO_001204 [Bonamia ostreae]|uniref:UAS domain-containing protein n=1 Tax=Bonamia ostreae TaxID=126728 RepID=A0ABV2AJ06_9EUKA
MEANLTSEKSEKLKTFKEYVLCEDTALCVRFLEEENWNVDEAVIKFLERPKTAQRSLLSRTATFASNLTTNIFSFFKSFFVADKKKEFEVTMNKFTKKYGPLHPEFSSDEFEKNVKRCASEKKLLFVYIHDSRPESKYSRGERYSVHDIDDFCRNALTSKPVVEFLNRNYISWMADVTSREAKNLGAQIRISKLPFLLIAAPSKNSAWVRVFQHEGRISEMTLLTCLLDSHSNFEDFTRREALRSEDRRKEQNLRKKQDEDYEKAINCDRDLHRDERDRAEKEKQERMERLKIEEVFSFRLWLNFKI